MGLLELIAYNFAYSYISVVYEKLRLDLLGLFGYNYGMFAKGTDKDVLKSGTSALKGFETMLTRKDVASILDISERQVCRLEKRGCLPRVHISTHVVRYLPKDLHQLIESMRVERN